MTAKENNPTKKCHSGRGTGIQFVDMQALGHKKCKKIPGTVKPPPVFFKTIFPYKYKLGNNTLKFLLVVGPQLYQFYTHNRHHHYCNH